MRYLEQAAAQFESSGLIAELERVRSILQTWRQAENRPVERHRRPRTARPQDLTAREIDVLRLVSRGLTDAEVAGELVVSPRTINTHLTSIYGKLGVTSRTAATRFALEHDLL